MTEKFVKKLIILFSSKEFINAHIKDFWVGKLNITVVIIGN